MLAVFSVSVTTVPLVTNCMLILIAISMVFSSDINLIETGIIRFKGFPYQLHKQVKLLLEGIQIMYLLKEVKETF
jgi:hypothetical protein